MQKFENKHSILDCYNFICLIFPSETGNNKRMHISQILKHRMCLSLYISNNADVTHSSSSVSTFESLIKSKTPSS